MTGALLGLLLAGAALPVAERAQLDAAVQEIFVPYTQSDDTPAASWQRHIYSAEIRALIAHWERVMPADEPDSLSDGDWLCQCQEFDHKAFRAVPLAVTALGPGTAEVRMRIDIGFGTRRDARIIMKKESAGWMLDDFRGPDFPKGLKQKIRETIAEDEKAR
jgi:hypothetical protein